MSKHGDLNIKMTEEEVADLNALFDKYERNGAWEAPILSDKDLGDLAGVMTDVDDTENLPVPTIFVVIFLAFCLFAIAAGAFCWFCYRMGWLIVK